MSRDAVLGERRWPAIATVAAVLAIYFALPGKFVLGPRWIVPAFEVALIVPLVVANPVRLTTETRVTRALAVALIGLISLSNAISLGLLVHELLRGAKLGGNSLFLSAAGIWITNVLVFTLWFWELDRGGPVARAFGEALPPDFLFPQMSNPELAGRDWMPGFVDYFYTSFTNCTAFSPTDTMPLSPWSKLLMLLQSGVSLVTVAVVAARAVNILT